MKYTDVVDWRAWKAALVASDSATAKAGNHVYVMTVLEKAKIGDVAFITPNPVALALNLAIRGAKAAVKLGSELNPAPATPSTKTPTIPPAQTGFLYDFFEHCMTSVTFSYQAIEAFANQLIAEGLTGTIRVERKQGAVDWTAEEIQRQCSTEEKVGVVLPAVTKVKSPKGLKLWQQLVTLKELRDATIHLKSKDQYVRGRPDNQTLYFQLLSFDPLDGPRCAIDVIKYFSSPVGLTWVEGATVQLS